MEKSTKSIYLQIYKSPSSSHALKPTRPHKSHFGLYPSHPIPPSHRRAYSLAVAVAIIDNNSVAVAVAIMDYNSVARVPGPRTVRKNDRNKKRENTLKDEAEKKASAGGKARWMLSGSTSTATASATASAIVADKPNGTSGAAAGGPIVSRLSGTIVQCRTPPTFDWLSRPTTSSSVVEFSSVGGDQRTDRVDNIDDYDKEDPLCATDYVQEMVSILHVALSCILISFSSAYLTNRAPPSLSLVQSLP